ncbi:MAG: GAF domain-containing protein [Lentisphaeria bacterium]|nr:GAF domain-containing protein [Lentisphaeria bacterium]
MTPDIEIDVPENVLQNWQEIANILSQICHVPAALIMKLAEPYLEVFVSSHSDGNPYHPGDREVVEDSGLYCETVIKTKSELLVPDARADETWKDNPDIANGMVSYLGFPICLPNGKPFGTICLLDSQRNEYSALIRQLMLKYRNMIESQLELIYMNQVLGSKNQRLTDYLMEIQALRGLVPICSNCKAIRDAKGVWHPVEHYLAKHPEADFSHGICPECMRMLYPDLP